MKLSLTLFGFDHQIWRDDLIRYYMAAHRKFGLYFKTSGLVLHGTVLASG